MNKQVKYKPKSFTFTKSSKCFPVSHQTHEFSSIIQVKKNYQSLIKDELQKLEQLENVEEPIIQEFKLHKQLLRNEAQEDFLESANQYNELIQKIQHFILSRRFKKFHKKLKNYEEKIKKIRAANYFHFIKIMNNTFMQWKNGIELSEIRKEETEKLTKFKKQNQFKKFVSLLKVKDLTKRIKVFSDMISYRKMRNFLKLLKNLKVNENQFWGKKQQLFNFFLTNKFRLFKTILEEEKGLKTKKDFIKNITKHRNFIQFQQICQKFQIKCQVKDNMKSLSFNRTLVIPDHINYPDEHLFQQKKIILQKSIQEKDKKSFFKILSTQNKIIICNYKRMTKNLKQFYTFLKENCEISKKMKQILLNKKAEFQHCLLEKYVQKIKLKMIEQNKSKYFKIRKRFCSNLFIDKLDENRRQGKRLKFTYEILHQLHNKNILKLAFSSIKNRIPIQEEEQSEEEISKDNRNLEIESHIIDLTIQEKISKNESNIEVQQSVSETDNYLQYEISPQRKQNLEAYLSEKAKIQFFKIKCLKHKTALLNFKRITKRAQDFYQIMKKQNEINKKIQEIFEMKTKILQVNLYQKYVERKKIQKMEQLENDLVIKRKYNLIHAFLDKLDENRKKIKMINSINQILREKHNKNLLKLVFTSLKQIVHKQNKEQEKENIFCKKIMQIQNKQKSNAFLFMVEEFKKQKNHELLNEFDHDEALFPDKYFPQQKNEGFESEQKIKKFSLQNELFSEQDKIESYEEYKSKLKINYNEEQSIELSSESMTITNRSEFEDEQQNQLKMNILLKKIFFANFKKIEQVVETNKKIDELKNELENKNMQFFFNHISQLRKTKKGIEQMKKYQYFSNSSEFLCYLKENSLVKKILKNKFLQFIHISQQQNNRKRTKESYQQVLTYFKEKVQEKTIEKVFKELKSIKQKKIQSEKEQYSLKVKAFEGLKMFYKQKVLLNKYLNEYDLVTYYPRSTEQLNRFKEIVSRDC